MSRTGHTIASSRQPSPIVEPAPALVAIGHSAGGLAPLRELLEALPSAFSGAIVIAQHAAAGSDLVGLLRLWLKREVVYASPGALLCSGVVFVRPAQHHIAVRPDATLAISQKERVRFARPSIDWLFESAAASYAERAIAVVLSGANADGARGARRIAANGGSVIVQRPDTARWRAMPEATLRYGIADACVAPEELAAAIASRVAEMEAAHQPACHAGFFSGSSQVS